MWKEDRVTEEGKLVGRNICRLYRQVNAIRFFLVGAPACGGWELKLKRDTPRCSTFMFRDAYDALYQYYRYYPVL